MQPYLINVKPAIRSLDVQPSEATIKSGQSVEFFITLESTLDVTIILDCGIPSAPSDITYIQQITDLTPILIGNCTYSTLGTYYVSVSAMNPINLLNQSARIVVEPSLTPFEVEVEDLIDINRLTSVTIRALEQIPYEGTFTLTIVNNFNEKNHTKTETVQLLKSNNFTEQLYINITTYGKQTLHVRGGDFPTIRQAQTTFVVGTPITKKPQVYVTNPIGLVNEDFIWIDVQWTDGIGFDIQVDYGYEKKVILRYGQFIFNPLNRTMKKVEGIHHIQWRRLAKQRLQIGYK